MISNNKISNLVASQLPFFVRNDHDNFIAFMEAYYEFLEQQTGVVNVSRSLLNQSDIDLTDLFVEKFYDNFLPFIPKDAVVDKTLILKHIKDFYRARGTEKSIRFLMRALFDEDVEFYYPQKDVLKVSDGKWFVEKSIKITDIFVGGTSNTDLAIENKFIGREIRGSSSNARAIVETTSSYYEGTSVVRELKLSGQYKNFQPGEQIVATFLENGIEKTISANLFSGGLNSVEIVKPGSRYQVGDVVTIDGGGTGGSVIVTSVSRGDLSSIATLDGGSGFQVNNPVLITGGGGSGANANVTSVLSNSFYHPNTYNIVSSLISLEANTPLNNLVFSNLNSKNVNTSIANAVSYFRYANTGPIVDVFMYNIGTGYESRPTIAAQANTRIKNLGILGKMRIVSGGAGYYIGDTIKIQNIPGGTGTGAAGRVRNVDTSQANTITEVEFVSVPGHIIGGSGYDQYFLPSANIVSVNNQAYGANVRVVSVLGSGEVLVSANSTEGAILSLAILSRGSGYDTAPTLNLSTIGDGTAQAVATIITGVFSYPGRYLNDDGHISSYNFIQDRDYYQKFSYVVKLRQSIEKYRKTLKTLIHPAGMKLFGEYVVADEGTSLNLPIRDIYDNVAITLSKTYEFTQGNVFVYYSSHGLSVNSVVYLDWTSGNLTAENVTTAYPYDSIKGPYKVKRVVNTNQFVINTVPYIANTNIPTYLANTSLPNTSGTVNVSIIIH